MKKLIFAVLVLALVACRSREPELYTIRNASGMEASITNYGGRIVSLLVPDREGRVRDVVLGFDDLKDYYPERNETDFGASIGRYANRIKDGLISIDGKQYQLPRNNYGHCLHGGTRGWQYQFYKAVEVSANRLKLERVSPDGDQGFPGNLDVRVTYELGKANELRVRYRAVPSEPTLVNLTCHAYWNLNGHASGSALDHELCVRASRYTPTDAYLIPTGELASVAGTPLDLREPHRIGSQFGAGLPGFEGFDNFDHNFVLDGDGADGAERPASTLVGDKSGVRMRVLTTAPGLQVYTASGLNEGHGKDGAAYGPYAGVALETQLFPDAVHHPEFPQVTNPVFTPDRPFASTTTFSFE